MKKLMIAVDSQSLRQALTQMLSDRFDILTASDGAEALELLHQWKPELLLIDLSLRQIDGICVLRNAFALGIRPQVIALTVYISEYVLNALSELPVSCLLRIPCDLATLTARIIDVSQQDAPNSAAEEVVMEILAVLGFKLNTAGTRILQEAILQYSADPQMPLTTQLYPLVAQKIGGTPSQVERAIRSAIEAAWKNRNEGVWRMYLPPGRNGKIPKPTNAAFLTRIVLCLPDTERHTYPGERIV